MRAVQILFDLVMASANLTYRHDSFDKGVLRASLLIKSNLLLCFFCATYQRGADKKILFRVDTGQSVYMK